MVAPKPELTSREAPTRLSLATGDDMLNRDGTLDWSGQWSGVATSQDSSGAQKWVRATTKAQGSVVSFTVPSGTSRVSLLGAVDIDHNEFQVTLTPAPPQGQASFDLSAWNLFTVQNVSMFDLALDAKQEYKMAITNKAATGAYLDISEVVFYRTKEAGGGGLSTGAIVGIAVGCSVAGLAGLALLGWLLYRRRQKAQNAQKQGTMDLESDHGLGDHVEPFEVQRPVSQVPSGAPGAGVAGVAAGFAPGPGTVTSSVGSAPMTQSNYVPIGTASSSSSDPMSASARYSTTPSLTLHNPDHYPSNTVGIAALSAKNPAPPVMVQHVHHTDGGALPVPVAHAEGSGVMIEETPPTYNPDWAPGSSASAAGGSEAAPTVQRSEKN